MAYIGNAPAEAYTNTVKDTFSGNGSTVAFTLSLPSTTNNVRVVVENVIQDPAVAYNVSGTTLTFTSAPPSGTDNIYAVHLGPAVQTVQPPTELSGNFTLTGSLTAAADGAAAITANRLTSDGAILDLKKDGTTVGTLGVSSSTYLTIGTGDTGILFDNAGNRFYPCNASTQANLDNAIDIGASTVRFKDLYLSGGVYLGGTGGANLLNDYEYGDYQVSFTPSGGGSITVAGSQNDLKYTKIGSRVFVSGKVDISAASSPSGYIAVTLPFAIHNSGTANDSRRFNGSIWVTGTALSTYEYQLYGIEGESSVRIYDGSGNSMASTSANQFSGDEGVTFSFHYETTP